MHILAEINDQDINPGATVAADTSAYEHRHAARAVVLNATGHVALLHATKRQHHTLPGGGVELGEDVPAALHREIMEELGCEIAADDIQPVGRIIEQRDDIQQVQTSDCYLVRQVGAQRTPVFTAKEQDHGFEAVWTPDIDAAIARFEADTPTTYIGKFINKREPIFLEAAKTLLDKR